MDLQNNDGNHVFTEHKGHPSLQAMMETLPNAVVTRDSAAEASESMCFLRLIFQHHIIT